MKKIITNPMINYENKWVALSKDGKKVIASSSNLKLLDQKIQKIKNIDFTVTKVLPFDTILAP